MWDLLPLPLTQETEGLLDAGRFETAPSQRGARPRVARPATRSRRAHCGSIGLERRTDYTGLFSDYRGESERSQRIAHAGHLGNQLPNLPDAVSLVGLDPNEQVEITRHHVASHNFRNLP